MKSLEEIFEGGLKPEKIMEILSSQVKDCPSWGELEKNFVPKLHDIIADPSRRPRVKVKNAKKEVPAKLVYPAEMIAARRMNQMAFSIPVKRRYSKPSNDSEKAFQNAIDKVYEYVRIDGVNAKRFYAYFAGCECATFWFVVEGKEEHNRYGFSTKSKIRCRSFSPMPKKYSKITSAKIYPYFDDMDDLIVLSFEYRDADSVDHFDAFTAEKAYYFTREGSEWILEDVDIDINKIPAIYLCRPLPIYDGISTNRDDIEFTLSRNSDNIRKNSTPILKIMGTIEGDMPVGDTSRQVYKLEQGGDLDLVAPALTTSDSKTHVDMLKQINCEVTQLPDLSLENIKGLGAQSGEARKTLLTDAHLKVKEESHDIIEFLDREFEVVKAIVAHENPEWIQFVHTTTCKHVITPFIQNDTTTDINNLTKANGGKAIISHKASVMAANLVEDPEADYEQIETEEAEKAETERQIELFPGAE